MRAVDADVLGRLITRDHAIGLLNGKISMMQMHVDGRRDFGVLPDHRLRVFHINGMTEAQKRRYRRYRR